MMTNNGDWLTEVFRQADEMYTELPEWAQPVLTRPMSAAGAGDIPADADEASVAQSAPRT